MSRRPSRLAVVAALLLVFQAGAVIAAAEPWTNPARRALDTLDATLVPTSLLYDRVLPLSTLVRHDGRLAAGPDVAPVAPVTAGQWRQMLHELTRSALTAPTWPDVATFRTAASRGRESGHVPLAVLDFTYNRLRPDAVSTGHLSWRDGRLLPAAGVTSAELLTTHRAFAAAALVPRTYHGAEVVFELSPDHLVGNVATEVQALAVDFDDGAGLRPMPFDRPVTVRYATVGPKAIEVVATLDDGDRLRSICAFEVAALAAPAPQEIWPITATESYDGVAGTGEAFVYLAPDHAALTEPVIVVEGFDLDNTMGWDELYELLNTEQLLETLRGEGYDAVVLNFTEATDPIQRNAFVLNELIRQVRTAQSDERDLVVIGASMGGLVARYALTYLEHTGQDHHTRTFISFDAPHGGANIPLGLQDWLQFFQGESTDAAFLLSRLDTPAARQMLLYHHASMSGNTPQADPLLADFSADLAGLGDYPALTRNVAVANGSGTAQTQGYAAGAQLIRYEYASFLVDITGNVWALPDGTSGMIFDGEIDRIWPLDDDALSVTVSGTIPWDNAPGGARPSQAQMDTTAVPYGDIVALHDAHCFIPTISALDLATGDPFFDIAGQADLSALSPFDVLYWPAANQEHVLVTPENKAWFLEEILRDTTPVDEDQTALAATTLQMDSYPNPFNPLTRISFTVPTSGPADLVVYDAAGRLVRRLFAGEVSAGRHVLAWDGRDRSGRDVASGVYLCRLTAGDRHGVRRLVLAR